MANDKSGAVDSLNDVRLEKEQAIAFTGIDLLLEEICTISVPTFVQTAFTILDRFEGSWADVISQLATRPALDSSPNRRLFSVFERSFKQASIGSDLLVSTTSKKHCGEPKITRGSPLRVRICVIGKRCRRSHQSLSSQCDPRCAWRA